MSINLSEKEKHILSEVILKHLSSRNDIEVILFGSMVDGKIRKTSDIDIAIKSDTPLDKALWAKIEEDFVESDLTRKVDVVDYQRVEPDFQKVIDTKGVLLFAPKPQ